MNSRVKYLEEREGNVSPLMIPQYHRIMAKESGESSVSVLSQRMMCVDIIVFLCTKTKEFDTTIFAAVRLFDRCMSAMTSYFSNNCLLFTALGCFNIVHKSLLDGTNGDLMPTMEQYYQHVFLRYNYDIYLTLDVFKSTLFKTEVYILNMVKEGPVYPAAQDYLAECFSLWFAPPSPKSDILYEEFRMQGRRASLLCTAFLYTIESAEYTAEQIAATAARLTIGQHNAPSPEMEQLCKKVNGKMADKIGEMMLEEVEYLFAAGNESMLYYFYNDLYKVWSKKTTQM
jgi:hypothetical protein